MVSVHADVKDLSFSGYLFRVFFSVMWNMEKLHLPMMEWLLQAGVCVHPEVVLDHPPCTSCSVIPPLSGRGDLDPGCFSPKTTHSLPYLSKLRERRNPFQSPLWMTDYMVLTPPFSPKVGLLLQTDPEKEL